MNNSSNPQANRTFCQVVVEHQSACPDPLRIKAGQELTTSDMESDWSGWVWCTDGAGKGGWVPEWYVVRTGASCTALCDYDATELSASVGEVLEAGKEEDGWIWCTGQGERGGWIPVEKVQNYAPARKSGEEKTNAMRLLNAHGTPYQVITFPPDIRSASGVAEQIGLPLEEVYKTLVVRRPRGKPMLVLIDGGRELNLKELARAVGEKKMRMASRRDAEGLTGFQVGAISALALLNHPFDVFIDRRALDRSHVCVSAGRRGINLRLPVADLIRLTRARVIDATAP